MAVTSFVFGKAPKHTSGDSFLANDIRVALLTSAWTPDQDANEFWNDIKANEAAGAGYTANGQALATKTFGYNAGTNVNTADADDSSWAATTITARYAVVYDRTPATDATRPLIAYQDFGADVTSTAGTFLITWNASGIFRVTVA
jgi:hypothetical protein